MICFDVFVNGEKVCRAGKEEVSVLDAMVMYVSEKEDVRSEELALNVGALFSHSGANVHVRWADQMELKMGDEVIIRIVDADDSDEPSHEKAYTKEDDQRSERAYFERLKAKYEGEGT